MKHWKRTGIVLLVVLVLICIYYYISLPAINIHAAGFWTFILSLLAVIVVIVAVRAMSGKGRRGDLAGGIRDLKELKSKKSVRSVLVLFCGVFLFYIAGSVLSSPVVNAKRYQKLLEPEVRDFTEDVEPVDYDKIPLLDKDSAELLGNRKMGSMVDMVSQFEVSSIYSQINVKGRPVRVTPLVYASPIKWLTNQKQGIPAYITIDMATQNTDLVKLSPSIRYSESEYFNRNIYRHLRFHYPTYIFDQLSFEIDDEGTPYWICPVKEFTIGLFGGQTIGKVVLCNAVTGECESMPVEDCPTWVDRVYPADLLIELYDYHGTLVHGFFNSILGQKGCLKTTEGYNYLALDDDVWVYTGVTSVSGDRSNVGFVLINQRTRETRYYEVAGAEEYSAMESAEGQVQNLGYRATFPLLLNIADEPTYFIALKDNAGLVKKYAMVNIQKYQNVAIGDTVAACEQTYVKMLKSGGSPVSDAQGSQKIQGTIQRIAQGVIEGNTHFYLVLEDSDLIFDVPLTEYMEVLRCDVGDKVTIEYSEGDPVSTLISLTFSEK